MGGEMTKCITLNGKVINVGPWEDSREEVVDRELDDVPADAVIIEGYWHKNPMPEGAIEEDIALAWTDDGRIVRGDDPLAEMPYQAA